MRYIWWLCCTSFVWNCVAATLNYWWGNPVWLWVSLASAGLAGLCWLDAERVWRRRINRL